MRTPDRAPLSPPLDPDNPPDVDPSRADTDRSPADQQNRLRDAEILGKSVKVRLAIDTGVTKAIANTHEGVAKLKNVLSTPKNAYLRVKKEAAEDKYQRKLDKVGNSHWKTINKHRQKVATKYKEKLDRRSEKYNSHSSMMQGRLDKVQGIRDHHESIHKRKIEAFRDRKEIAQGRKEIRHLRNEVKNRGVKRLELNRIMGQITPEQRKRIGAVACRKEVAERGIKGLERAKNRATNKADKTDEKLQSILESAESKRKTKEQASKQLDDAVELRDDFQDRISQLRTERQDLIDANNPDNEDRLEEIEVELEREHDGLDRAERQVTIMRNKIQSLSESLAYLGDEEARLTDKLGIQDRKAEGLSSVYDREKLNINRLEQEHREAFRAAASPMPAPSPATPAPDPAAPPDPPVTPPTPPDTSANS